MSQDPIHSLTAELEQLFMQDDFDGAKYALERFIKKAVSAEESKAHEGYEEAFNIIQDMRARLDEQSEENKRLRAANSSLRSQLSRATESANRHRQWDEDYIPYPDEDYRD